MRLTILTGKQLGVNLVVVPSEFLEDWMNEWNALYDESCPRSRTDFSFYHQEVACNFRKPKSLVYCLLSSSKGVCFAKTQRAMKSKLTTSKTALPMKEDNPLLITKEASSQ